MRKKEKCDECGKVFDSLTKLRIHNLEKHVPDPIEKSLKEQQGITLLPDQKKIFDSVMFKLKLWYWASIALIFTAIIYLLKSTFG